MRIKKVILDELNKERSKLTEMRNPKMDKRFTESYLIKIKKQIKLVNALEKEYIASVSCIDCIHLKETMCHPSNKIIGKGTIIDRLGWVCINPESDKTYFFENQYGYCELFEQKKNK